MASWNGISGSGSTTQFASTDINSDDLQDLWMASQRTEFVWIGLNTSLPVAQP